MNLNRAFFYSAARYALLVVLIFIAAKLIASSMQAALAVTFSVARCFLLAGLIFLILKLIATVFQILLTYRRQSGWVLHRMAYIVGKVTPALAAASLCVWAILQHDQRHSWIYGLLAVFAASLATFVVHLRRQGKFLGVFGTLSNGDKRRA